MARSTDEITAPIAIAMLQTPSNPETIETKKIDASPSTMPMATFTVGPSIFLSSQVPTFMNTECAPAHRRSFMNSDSNMSLSRANPAGVQLPPFPFCFTAPTRSAFSCRCVIGTNEVVSGRAAAPKAPPCWACNSHTASRPVFATCSRPLRATYLMIVCRNSHYDR